MERRVPRVEMAEERRRLGFAISSARKERSLTPRELAARLGRAYATILRWEAGETVMTALDVKPLSIALGVTYDLFVDPPEITVYPIKRYLVENQPQNPNGQ